MKRVKLVLMVLTLLFIVCISSCNKVSKFNNQNYGKIKYYVAGLYIQVNEYDEFDLDDPNPKIYFDFSSTKHFGMLNTKSGALDAAVNISNLSKTIKEEDGINKYYMTAKLNFVNSDVSKIKLYPIYIDEDNKIFVDEELNESVNIISSSSYNYIVSFTKNKLKYQLQMSLLFK